ncbi:unnamed protein product [Effrenium voratum]|uniref:Uncharacterized protein n=1 Tax=Effrenium voratum TaxID=2562239 RepID=A0AA36ILH8_9DINO|nr:unnamed protein product [Effrenium voratum]
MGCGASSGKAEKVVKAPPVKLDPAKFRSVFKKGGFQGSFQGTSEGVTDSGLPCRLLAGPPGEVWIAKIVDSVGVDVAILCDMLDLVYEDAERRGSVGLPFEDIVELVLSMRGSNPATLKDVKEASGSTSSCLSMWSSGWASDCSWRWRT